MQDMECKINSRLSAGGHSNEHSDSSLLKRLTNAAKSSLYENFTVQPISADYPADVAINCQLDKA